ncbi:MAG: hypothetical protein IPJ51_06325 [Saprospiraceae bacterium]|nr:hypothetical protein [Saprospiraceae bacterium]
MQTRYLILMLNLIFILNSCNIQNKSIKCNIPSFDSIHNYVNKNNPDTIDAYINEFQRFGFYKNAFALINKLDHSSIYGDLDSFQLPQNLSIIPATDFLAKNAEKYDIIMLNENHYLPQHRVFAHSLLETLKKNGYKYLALEAVYYDQEIPILTEEGINHDLGYYTKEVFYSNFIKCAVESGFEVFGYEPNYNSDKYGEIEVKVRDYDMCKNILSKWNVENGKLLIFCGFGHNFKQNAFLRSYLEKEDPKLKIMSINQINLNEEISSQIQDKIRKKINLVIEPSVLIDSMVQFTIWKNYETEIIHPTYNATLSDLNKVYRIYRKFDIPKEYLAYDLYFYNSKNLNDLCKINPIGIYRHQNEITSINLPIDSQIFMYKIVKGETHFISCLKF